MGLNGCCYLGFNSTHVDMAPDFAATLMGLTNTFGNLDGFIAPIVSNNLTSGGVGFQK
jgi:ACS family sodium-dependent inorganic phosphate cotransporter-like MFS transporter 5